MKVLVGMGTWPEAVKMAPIVKAIGNRPEAPDGRLCATEQRCWVAEGGEPLRAVHAVHWCRRALGTYGNRVV